jgi:hypothetical protein
MIMIMMSCAVFWCPMDHHGYALLPGSFLTGFFYSAIEDATVGSLSSNSFIVLGDSYFCYLPWWLKCYQPNKLQKYHHRNNFRYHQPYHCHLKYVINWFFHIEIKNKSVQFPPPAAALPFVVAASLKLAASG